MRILRTRRTWAVLLACALAAAAAVAPGASAGRDDDDQDRLMRKLDRMSLEEKVGQMFMTYAYGTSVDQADPRNQSTYGVDSFRQLIERYHLGGIIYFAWSDNVKDPRQIAGLSNGIQKVATSSGTGVPALVSTDQEQGLVVRVTEPATQFPGNMALGAARYPGLARSAAAVTGEELRAMGINENFAPVADVNVNPENPVIGVRSFSSNPGLVASLTEAQVRGYQREDVASTAKHFPGHGDTSVDSHTGLPVIDHAREELDRIDLPPFAAAIDAGVESIMTAHIVVPALDDSGRPATLSRPILTDLLRREMNFDGVVVTDALTMEGVREMFGDDRVPVEAIKAGADLLLMPPDLDLAYRSVLEAVRSGEISERRIDRSVYRILRLKERLGLFEQPFVKESKVAKVVGNSDHLAVADDVTERTVTLVKNGAGTLPLAADSGKRALVTGWGASTTARLASQVRERGLPAEVYETGASPSDAAIAGARAAAERNDLVVAVTNRAWSSPAQQRLVGELVASGKPVIVAAVRDPYDIAHLSGVDTYVATYGYAGVSVRALAKVLFGEVNPSGKLPVDIPAAGDPGTTLYPFGHGLGY
ncbi:MAG: glycoside hydrolase family 3 protein [Thermoleophilaceae bacterium]